jgi:hypothetical protein
MLMQNLDLPGEIYLAMCYSGTASIRNEPGVKN